MHIFGCAGRAAHHACCLHCRPAGGLRPSDTEVTSITFELLVHDDFRAVSTVFERFTLPRSFLRVCRSVRCRHLCEVEHACSGQTHRPAPQRTTSYVVYKWMWMSLGC